MLRSNLIHYRGPEMGGAHRTMVTETTEILIRWTKTDSHAAGPVAP
jgi:hypothetical protein